MSRRVGPILAVLCVLGAIQAQADIHIEPADIQLNGNFERVQLVVSSLNVEGQLEDRSQDLTGKATYRVTGSPLVEVSQTGSVLALANGETTIEVHWEGKTVTVPVSVQGVLPQGDISFTTHVRPILNKLGCASAACHASQYGKGGFKLSVFGFDPRADYEAMARESRQRRVNFASPGLSMILQKPTMQRPHGGGKRMDVDSVEHDILAAWISGGANPPQKDDLQVESLEVSPGRRVTKLDDSQQLRVVARYSDGSSRDVTALCLFDSMDDGILSVNDQGRVRVVGEGQAAVMVRYEGQTAISMMVVPFSDNSELVGWQNNNFIDELAAAKFRELGLQPSPLCDDATFVRRAYLDAIGALPTIEESKAFLASTDPDKRTHLIDRLLGLTGDPALDIYNDRYAAFWTLKWSDLIRNNSKDLGEQGMWSLHNWIRESLRTNQRYDQFVRELVTAKGSIYSNGPANYFRINKDSSALTESTAQLFLGVRLECAKCHHHPFEKYSQADYYGLAAFFSRVGTKNSEEFGLFGRETVVMVRSSGDVRHPRTGQTMEPTPLEGEPQDHPLDRRIALAEWLTSADNDLFARSVVNRYMGYLLGRGLVEPIDDMRSTNPPSNVAMMDALSQDFVDSGYDLKHLMRTIMTSRIYQLSSQPTPENASDRRFFSHYRVKRVAAEPLLDAIDQVTDIRTKFRSLPLGTRAIELPDAEYPNYFLKTFAKPRRASVCECERSPDENLAQALHTLNGETLTQKISHKDGRIARLLAEKKEHDEIVNELYLATLCREASAAELASSREFLGQSPTPQEHYEDLLWALINSKQFLFVR